MNRNQRPSQLGAVVEAVVGAAAAQDAQANSYETTREPGVVVEGATTSVTGANGRRILIRDDADGVYVGGVLITSRADMSRLLLTLSLLADARLS